MSALPGRHTDPASATDPAPATGGPRGDVAAPRALPRTARGARTRAKLLVAAENVFETVGYHEASIVKITEQAGVALGTFYVHFPGKKEIFDEVVMDLSRRVRQAMSEGARGATDRIEAERLGFDAFFRFTAEHPALYRIIRQAEFVSPEAMRAHYDAICGGYVTGLTRAQESGEIRDDIDPTVAAWALMGAGELIGMRWVLWDRAAQIDPAVYAGLMDIIEGALAPRRPADARTNDNDA